MWYCSVSESKESDHLGLADGFGGGKFYVGRKRKHVEALTGEARKLDRKTAEALKDEHGLDFTAYVLTSKYDPVERDEPEKITLETHTHWVDSLIKLL